MSTSFNVSMDRLGWYYDQAANTSADLFVVALKAAGLQADDVLADHDTFAAIIAAGNVEADFTNYNRKTIASPTRTRVNATDRVHLGGAAQGVAYSLSWPNAGGAVNNQLGKVIVLYVPVPGTSTTSDMVPLSAHDITATTDTTELVITFHVDGAIRVRKP